MSNRIKALRENHDIKQVDLARELNVSQSTLSNWERGKHDPDNASLIQLSNIFNVSTDYILGLSNSKISQKEKPTANEGNELSVEERVEQILEGMADTTSGPLMLDGEPASQEALDALRQAIHMGVEYARKINKEKK